MAKSSSIVAGLLLSCQLLFGQDGRYAIFFGDKAGSSYTIDNPQAFLSARSIERRAKQSIPVNEADIPVNANYIADVKNLGADILYSSRWMNALIVQLDNNELGAVMGLPYVVANEYIAPINSASGGRVKKVRDRKDSNLGTVNQTQNTMLGIDDMHGDGYLGEGILIGVFDSGFIGVDVTVPFQPLLQEGRLQLTKDLVGFSDNVFQYDDHGTEVLSIMAADQVGLYLGGAPKATYQLFVTEDIQSEFRIEEYNWLRAAEIADSAGVDIINASLGYNLFDDPSMDYTVDDLDGETAVVTQAAQLAADRGILVVASAGNDGNTSWKFVNPPADGEAVMAVGSITSSGTLSSFSSIGPTADGRIKPDVVTLGSSVSVIKANGTSGFTSGTSMSSPLVASLAAGLWQAFPELSAMELFDLIISSGNLYQSPNNQMGYGVPDYTTAATIMNPEVPVVPASAIVLYPNPVTTNTVNIDMDIPVGDYAEISIYNLQGQLVFNTEGVVTYENNPIVLDLSQLAAGMYVVIVETSSLADTFRMVKW